MLFLLKFFSNPKQDFSNTDDFWKKFKHGLIDTIGFTLKLVSNTTGIVRNITETADDTLGVIVDKAVGTIIDSYLDNENDNTTLGLFY